MLQFIGLGFGLFFFVILLGGMLTNVLRIVFLYI